MADVILFHHALGLTAGVQQFAERLRAGGHRVITPDLYDGLTFDDLDAGVANAEKVGFGEIIRRGIAAAADIPTRCVYAGFSLGSLPAQKLAQTWDGALGALLYHGGIPPSEFGTTWPSGVALQIHVTEHDQWNELPVVQQLAGEAKDSELFVYPGSAHLVAEPGFGEFDPAIAELIAQRSVAFLNRWP